MATILELSRHADVSAENVLRVLNGEPVSVEVSNRVGAAIQALGRPPYPRPMTGEVVDVRPGDWSVERARDELLQAFSRAAAELEETLPQGVGSVVYEALRVEVRPVAQHLSQLAELFARMAEGFDRLATEVRAERTDRLEDVALLTELITTGWRSVDRRVGRLERMMERLQEGPRRPSGKVIHFETPPRRAGDEG